MPAHITNYLTIDVDDYYQVSAFEGVVRPEEWPEQEGRVEKNTIRSRLKNATLEQLELWAENILDAATIEDVFQIH